LKTALIAGLGLAQIGEFSFVLADKGRSFNLISENVYMLVLGTTAMTLVVTPFVLQFLPIILSKAESSPVFEGWLMDLNKVEVSWESAMKDHVIVCGYGRVGQNVVRLLLNQGYKVLVIDQSEEKIKKLRKNNIPYLYGSASSLFVLEKAEVCSAKAMAIALPDSMSSRLCLKRALQLNPELDTVIRANDAEEIEMLYQLGAKEVIQPEFEASLELSGHLLRVLGLPNAMIIQDIQKIRQSQYQTLQPDRSNEEILRELQEAVSTMENKWFTLPADSSLINLTLEKAHIRRLTGVSIIEIVRANGDKIDYPPADTVLQEFDRLLLVGTSEDFQAFEYIAKEKVMLPKEGESCVWVSIPKNSQLATEKLEEIKNKEDLGVIVQGIRRKNQYIRFPNLEKDIKAGDNILLFGKSDILSQL
jgi:CPA2 family monovalent cation:H+ antiporter-2